MHSFNWLPWPGEELIIWPPLRYQSLNPLNRFTIRKTGSRQAVPHDFDNDLTVPVDEVGNLQGVFLIGNLDWLLPSSLIILPHGRMPDKNAKGMLHGILLLAKAERHLAVVFACIVLLKWQGLLPLPARIPPGDNFNRPERIQLFISLLHEWRPDSKTVTHFLRVIHDRGISACPSLPRETLRF